MYYRNSEKICRICFDNTSSINNLNYPDTLISPCLCKGTSKWIHRSCLDQWRKTGNCQYFYHCDICKFKYQFEYIGPPKSKLLIIKFYSKIIIETLSYIFRSHTLLVFIMSFLYILDLYNQEILNPFKYTKIKLLDYYLQSYLILSLVLVAILFTIAVIINDGFLTFFKIKKIDFTTIFNTIIVIVCVIIFISTIINLLLKIVKSYEKNKKIYLKQNEKYLVIKNIN